MTLKKVALIAGSFIVLAGLMAVFAKEAPAVEPAMVVAQGDAAAGAAVYQATCSTCHQPGGVGIPGAFPPLAGNPKAADGAYVESVIVGGLSGPIEVLGMSYDAVMAPVELSESDLAAVIAYVATLAEGPPTTSAAPAPPQEADADRGMRLFEGSFSLENGGPACHACHSAGPIGFRGGSGLGPDLTDASDRFGGEAGMAAWLSSPASATMQPLFADKPLTSEETADVAAFLDSIKNEEPAGGIDQMLMAGVGGFLVLLAIMALLIRGPQETYTQRLRRQQ